MKSYISWNKILVGALLGLIIYSCTKDITGDYLENQPPETDIFIKSTPSDTLNPTKSVQTIFWDGRDPDGFVKGFFYTWAELPDSNDWIWTTKRSMVFPLVITGQDTSYVFQVKAVDNQDLQDQTPALQLFPIRNSAPAISWTPSSLIPDTTFTVASFLWSASDLDGDATITHFEYAIDDTSSWRKTPGFNRSISLNADSGIVEGEHIFFIRAVDIAGSRSKTIRMPEDRTWFAKNPRGRYLLIDDFQNEANSGFPDAYYKSMLNTILAEIGTGERFDYWNIEEQFPASRLQFTETMKLFERIIWYTDLIQESDQHFITAQVAIPEYLNYEKSGDINRKLIYTVQFNQGFGTQGSPLEFSPVDSLGSTYKYITTGSRYYPEPDSISDFYSVFGKTLPELKVSKIVLGLAALKPKVNSIPLYRYDDPKMDEDPLFVLLGKNDLKAQFDPEIAYDFVFSGTPMHFLNGNDNLNDFFRIIFKDVFKP